MSNICAMCKEREGKFAVPAYTPSYMCKECLRLLVRDIVKEVLAE